MRQDVILLEEATERDVPGIQYIADRALTEPYDPSFFFGMVQLAGDAFLVAREAVTGRIVGFALAVRETAAEARLLTLALEPGRQGQGLGGRLLREVERRLRRHGTLLNSLEVREDNARAIAFYRRHGYDIAGALPLYYHDGARAVLMQKAL